MKRQSSAAEVMRQANRNNARCPLLACHRSHWREHIITESCLLLLLVVVPILLSLELVMLTRTLQVTTQIAMLLELAEATGVQPRSPRSMIPPPPRSVSPRPSARVTVSPRLGSVSPRPGLGLGPESPSKLRRSREVPHLASQMVRASMQWDQGVGLLTLILLLQSTLHTGMRARLPVSAPRLTGAQFRCSTVPQQGMLGLQVGTYVVDEAELDMNPWSVLGARVPVPLALTTQWQQPAPGSTGRQHARAMYY